MSQSTISATIAHGITLGTGTYADVLTVISAGAVYGSGEDAGVLGKDAGITLTNAGRLQGYEGVYLYNGNGTVVNEAGGFISGGKYGIQSGNLQGSGPGHAPSAVFNAGTINGGVDGIALYSGGGNVTNTGTIIGNHNGIYIHGAGTLYNSGDIIGSNAHYAVRFTGAGDDRVVLAPTAQFYGAVAGSSYFNTVELISGTSAGTIANFNADFEYFRNVVLDTNATWTIASNADNDTFDLSGVTQANVLETEAGGAVTFGAGAGALVFENQPESVFSLSSDGAGGTKIVYVAGAISTITTALTSPIIFGAGVYNATLTVAGTGSIIPSSTVPYAAYSSANGVSLTNYGTIDSSGVVVKLASSGTVVNEAGGLISSNQAGPEGIAIYGPGVVANAGNIFANQSGVALFAGGTIINSGAIHGVGNVAVYLAGGGTVENSGLLKGPQAVQFVGSETDTLIITPTAVFQGSVAGGSGENTLALASGAGALSGLGAQFAGFSQLVVESGASWVLTGANTIANITGPGTLTLANAASLAVSGSLAPNLTLDFSSAGTLSLADAPLAQAVINNFIAGDTIDLTGVSATEIGFGPGGLTFQVGGVDETLDITGSLRASNFAFTSDSHGGTDITDDIITTLTTSLATGITLGSGDFLDRLFITQTGAVKTTGRAAIVSGDAAASLVNYGTVSGANYGTSFANGGVVINAATIAGSEALRMGGAAGTVANSGLVKGGFDGVVLTAGGNLSNTGTITGAANLGVYLEGGGTLTNTGTILGGVDAVQFKGAFADRLIVDPGAVFTGAVLGGTGTNTLELGSAASTGTLTGLGTSFSGFTGITLDAGAHWLLDGANTLSAGTTLSNAGNLTLSSTTLTGLASLVNDGKITLDPSFMEVQNLSGTGVLTIAAGSTLDVLGSISSGETIVFSGSGAELQITDTAEIAGTLEVTGSAATIDITDLAAPSFSSASFNAAADLLGITFTGATSPLELHGDFAGYSLAHATDGGDGTELTESPLCYLHGTQILTPAGLVKVEDLMIGDAVVTRYHGVQRIKWLGRQSYAAAFIGRNPEKWPVCIRAGALEPGVPARDLYVSPGHSMLLGDILVLAENLVNGVTVTQTRPAAEQKYVQLDLGVHDCVLAEGAWSETYADAPGQRAQFHNAAEYAALYPDEPPVESLTLCAPRPEQGAALEITLRPIAVRAASGIVAGPLEGWIDNCSDWRITGWALDVANPELPVLLEILLGGQVIGTVLACDFREDLRQAGKGRGYGAFSFTPPFRLPTDALAVLSIRRPAVRTALPGTERLRAQ